MTAQPDRRDRAFFDLSTRVKLRVSGADRLRFLNGQLTNDVRKATDTKAIEACVLNAKGKIEAHLFFHTAGDAFLLDANLSLQQTLQARLERYIIADDVQVEDVTRGVVPRVEGLSRRAKRAAGALDIRTAGGAPARS